MSTLLDVRAEYVHTNPPHTLLRNRLCHGPVLRRLRSSAGLMVLEAYRWMEALYIPRPTPEVWGTWESQHRKPTTSSAHRVFARRLLYAHTLTSELGFSGRQAPPKLDHGRCG